MNKCIMCGAEVFKDIGYVTDGKIFVCDRCAESHSLTRIMTRIENSGCESNLKSCYSAPIENGLVNQTESDEFPKPQGHISDCPFLPCDNCQFYYGEIDSCMVGEYRYTPTDEERKKLVAAYGEEGADDFFKPSFGDDITKEIAEDIFIMSPSDFISKYADNESAIIAYNGYNSDSITGEFLVNKELEHDLENMSEEDFTSKYCDSPSALEQWLESHGSETSNSV